MPDDRMLDAERRVTEAGVRNAAWAMSPRVLRKLRRISLAARKKFPAPRRFSRSVHRAYQRQRRKG